EPPSVAVGPPDNQKTPGANAAVLATARTRLVVAVIGIATWAAVVVVVTSPNPLPTVVEFPDATSPLTTVPAPAATAAVNGPQSVNVVAVLPRQMTDGFKPTAIVAGILK